MTIIIRSDDKEHKFDDVDEAFDFLKRSKKQMFLKEQQKLNSSETKSTLKNK